MPISSTNFSKIFSDYAIVVKDKILSSLDSQNKRIAAAVIVAIGCLVAMIVLCRCCCCRKVSAKKSDPDLLPKGGNKGEEDKSELEPVDSAKDLLPKGGNKGEEDKSNEVLAKDPNNENEMSVDDEISEAYALLNKGDYIGAEDKCNEVLVKDPNNFIAKLGCAEALQRQGKVDKAKKRFKKVKILIRQVLQQDPDNKIAKKIEMETKNKVQVYELIDSAVNLSESGDFEKAEQKFKDAINIGSLKDHVLAHYGVMLFKQGNLDKAKSKLLLDKAKKKFKAASNENGNNIIALVYFSGLPTKPGDTSGATKKLQKALEVNPKEAAVLKEKMVEMQLSALNFPDSVYQAVASVNEGKLDKAMRLFEQALKMQNINNADKYHALAHYGEALSLQSGLEEDPEHRKEKLAKAEAKFKEAEGLGTNNDSHKFYYLAHYGETLSLQSKLDAAEPRKEKLKAAADKFQEALKLVTDNNSDKFYAFAHYGETLSLQSKLNAVEHRQATLLEAVDKFQEALKLVTDNNSDKFYAHAHYGEALSLQSKLVGVEQRQAKLKEAYTQFQAALNIPPDDVYSLYYEKLQYKLGRLKKALLIDGNPSGNGVLKTAQTLSESNNSEGEEEELLVDKPYVSPHEVRRSEKLTSKSQEPPMAANADPSAQDEAKIASKKWERTEPKKKGNIAKARDKIKTRK